MPFFIFCISQLFRYSLLRVTFEVESWAKRTGSWHVCERRHRLVMKGESLSRVLALEVKGLLVALKLATAVLGSIRAIMKRRTWQTLLVQ